MLDWWTDQHWVIRYGVAVALLLVSTGFLIAGRIWPWGWIAGLVLLLFAGRSQSEKNGYNF